MQQQALDIFPMPNIELLQGDCLEVMPTLEANSIDLTVTSPPYDNLRTYNGNLEWNEDIWKAIIKELYRLTKQGGVVVWVAGDATIKGSETGTSFKQALWAKECGFNLHDTMIWEKDTQPCHDPRNKRYKQYFEYMFVFSKGKPASYNEIQDHKTKNGGKVVSGGKRRADGSMRQMGDDRRIVIVKNFMARKNIWQINTEKKGKHPAIFPEKLAHDHIISWSNEGDTVLDPMMGSNTTGKMAKQLTRNFIGIEKDPEYFKIAQRRIQ